MSPRWVFLALLPAASLRPTTDVVVTYRTFQATPDTVRVPTGSTVRWTNEDQVLHTVTGGTPERRTAGWDAALPTAGTSTTRRFDRAGTYTYFCDRHQFMRGTVVVTNTR
ncbi:MAG: cupredoxin domain-containing protein [Gemmatimonadetes bacterium]|nr:cupredoxin domain-containing protein [Gemmatimonadota bacterium]